MQYVTSTLPYIVLITLGIKGWFLEGSNIGVSYYITPNFEHLKNITLWIDAAGKFSL
jgi:SNF family Na+-dependent transporter